MWTPGQSRVLMKPNCKKRRCPGRDSRASLNFTGSCTPADYRCRNCMSKPKVKPPMRTTKLLCGGGLVLALAMLSLFAQQVPVVEKTLSNGMKLLLVERHDDPA